MYRRPSSGCQSCFVQRAPRSDFATSVRRRCTIVRIISSLAIDIIVMGIRGLRRRKDDRCGTPICGAVHVPCGDLGGVLREERSRCRVEASGSIETEYRASSRGVPYRPGRLRVAGYFYKPELETVVDSDNGAKLYGRDIRSREPLASEENLRSSYEVPAEYRELEQPGRNSAQRHCTEYRDRIIKCNQSRRRDSRISNIISDDLQCILIRNSRRRCIASWYINLTQDYVSSSDPVHRPR